MRNNNLIQNSRVQTRELLLRNRRLVNQDEVAITFFFRIVIQMEVLMTLQNHQINNYMQENEFVISICVPSFKKHDDVVLYQLVFTETLRRQSFSVEYRYSHLKKLHESLQTLKASMPKFPPTNWWRSTNNDEELIEERRIQLDYFFKNLLLCQEVCKSLIMKNFILKSQCLFLKKIEKEQREIIKKEKEAGAANSFGKPKAKSQLTTPVCGPCEDPVEDTRERARSWEFKPKKEKIQSISGRDQKQLNNLSFGGVPIFKGILLKLK